uniref:Microfibril associated protein 2 n=1 Tax=Varanus komodoensis TaxID=61221 RepID=A0A8D2JE03_VARKO
KSSRTSCAAIIRMPLILTPRSLDTLETEPTEPGPLGKRRVQSRCSADGGGVRSGTRRARTSREKASGLTPWPELVWSRDQPGPIPSTDCQEEQYPCTRLYSVHKPCKQCLNEICFYSLRRVYVINKEICVRTVCAHEELLRADLCRDKFSKCGVMASSGLCQAMAGACLRSCGGC